MFPGDLSVPPTDIPGHGVNKAKGMCDYTYFVFVIQTNRQSTLTMIR